MDIPQLKEQLIDALNVLFNSQISRGMNKTEIGRHYKITATYVTKIFAKDYHSLGFEKALTLCMACGIQVKLESSSVFTRVEVANQVLCDTIVAEAKVIEGKLDHHFSSMAVVTRGLFTNRLRCNVIRAGRIIHSGRVSYLQDRGQNITMVNPENTFVVKLEGFHSMMDGDTLQLLSK